MALNQKQTKSQLLNALNGQTIFGQRTALRNAGTSAGVKKEWETRKNGATGYEAGKYVGKVNFGKGGIDGSAILHPDHVRQVAALKDGGSTSFTDETGANWLASRSGDKVGFADKSAGSGLSGHVQHADIKAHADSFEGGNKSYPPTSSPAAWTSKKVSGEGGFDGPWTATDHVHKNGSVRVGDEDGAPYIHTFDPNGVKHWSAHFDGGTPQSVVDATVDHAKKYVENGLKK
jgi:hypothetical protein